MVFRNPPKLYNEQGEVRKVGFELEFSNLGIEESVKIIQDLYGGTIEKINKYYYKVNDTDVGSFNVEFDLTLLTEKSYKKFFDKLNINVEGVRLGETTLEEGIESVLESIVGKIFPYEIACPPVPVTQLEKIEKLRVALFNHHAEGTKAFLTNAFGTHINVEIPDLEVATIIRYLRAFILLYPWLLEKGDTDLARKISPFIDPYPDEYVELILQTEYNPDLDTFIEQFHLYNPDRNRPLDMYPLFASLRSELLKKYRDLGKVKPRNTFHYRLPNSSISQPEWSLAAEWNNWVFIEELADDPDRIADLANEYLKMKNDTLFTFENKWTRRIQEWLN